MGTWTERHGRLERSFKFKDFSQAFSFMTRVAMEAEKLGHHPTWTNTWNTVDIALSTHDAGGAITEKDRALAKAIDRVAGGKEEAPR